MCAIIFTINNIVLYPGAIPKHQSTNAGLVTYFLQQINGDLIRVACDAHASCRPTYRLQCFDVRSGTRHRKVTK